MANPIVTSLPEYVEQNRIGLIAEAVLGARTASLINFQTGIKTSAAINLLTTDVDFQDGSACGFNAAGEQTLSQRLIETGLIKVNMEYCDKNLLKTYAQHEVRIAAGTKTLPFEEDFINAVVANVKAGLEKGIWQGTEQFDGLLQILEAEEGKVTVSGQTETNVYNAIKAVVAAVKPTMLKEDLRIFVGTDLYVAYVQELVEKNLYHYSGNNENFEIVVPGTTIKVTAVDGLNATSKIVMSRASNLYYGTDMEGDEEKFDFWYSKDNGVFRLAIEFNAGVQVAFPDQVVYAALS